MSDQRMTYRERRLARAERLRDWAEGRDAKADAARAVSDRISGMIPMGQPILVGHHSEKRHRRDMDRIERGMRASIENGRKADDMRSRAENIEQQAERAIYSDDPDARERLEAKLADLEAERERIKRYNASCRKAAKADGIGDASLLDDTQREELATLRRVCSWQLGKGDALPSYKLSNLGGNISRCRERLAAM